MSDDLKDIIVSNIRSLRGVHNETSTSLAKTLGVSQSTVSDWENGKKMPRAEAIEKMANHWNINKSQILTKKKKTSVKADLIAAHIGNNVTEEEMNDILNYIDLIKRAHKGE